MFADARYCHWVLSIYWPRSRLWLEWTVQILYRGSVSYSLLNSVLRLYMKDSVHSFSLDKNFGSILFAIFLLIQWTDFVHFNFWKFLVGRSVFFLAFVSDASPGFRLRKCSKLSDIFGLGTSLFVSRTLLFYKLLFHPHNMKLLSHIPDEMELHMKSLLFLNFLGLSVDSSGIDPWTHCNFDDEKVMWSMIDCACSTCKYCCSFQSQGLMHEII